MTAHEAFLATSVTPSPFGSLVGSMTGAQSDLSEAGCIEGPLHQDYLLPKCELPPAAEYEPVETFVAKAVRDQHEKGDDAVPIETYGGILKALRYKTDTAMLRKLLLALRTAGNGSTLNLLTSSSSKHARLIHQVVRLNPFEVVDLELVDAHLHLILALVSANSVFLVPALTSLWKLLTSQYEDFPNERFSAVGSCTRSDAAAYRMTRLHAALASIMHLCPKAKQEVFPIIAGNFPFRTRPEAELVWYCSQCLHVLRYLSAIQGQVLELIVDKCLEIDVEIKITDTGEATIDEEKDDEEGIFELDLDQTEANQLPKNVLVDEMANKLDSLMLLLFEYTENLTRKPVNSTAIQSIYDVFSRVFESSVIITHKSKFVQFLILYVCGKENIRESGTLYRDFAAKLIDIILDPYKSTIIRQSAACYLASFVSRASFVCTETVCESISALLRWAETYLDALKAYNIHAADARGQCSLHSLFYTVCQSAFYIMCFRGVDAIEFFRKSSDPALSSGALDHINIGSPRWTRICSHPTQPLRYCLESVRSEFLLLSKVFDLLEPALLDLLERNDAQMVARERKKTASAIQTAATLEKQRLHGGVGGLGRGSNPLDSFFPFDPYLLRRSHGYVDAFYNHWTGSVHDAEDDVSTASNEVDEEEEADEPSESEVSDDDSSVAEAAAEFQPMSIASHATFASNTSSSFQATSPEVTATRDSVRRAWTDTLKRPRAQSIENGSW